MTEKEIKSQKNLAKYGLGSDGKQKKLFFLRGLCENVNLKIKELDDFIDYLFTKYAQEISKGYL